MQAQNTTKKNNKSRSAPKKVVSKRRQRQLKPQIAVIAYQKQVKSNNNIENNKFRYRRTELVSTVSTGKEGPSFQMDLRLRLNPGSAKTFPWLSGIASHFESYKFHSLKFHYVTRTPTTATGFIYLSPDYDAADAAPTGPILEAAIANNSDTVETAIWANKTLKLSPEKMNRLYKAHSVMDDLRFASTKQDQKTLDVGQVFVVEESTFGQGTKLGKLFVEYDVEFYEAQLPFEPVDANGATAVMDWHIVKTNTDLPFAAQPTPSSLSNAATDEVLSLYNGTYPSRDGFVFNRAWEGLVDLHSLLSVHQFVGRPQLLLNGKTPSQDPEKFKDMDKIPNVDINAIEKYSQYYVKAKEGDLLGLARLVLTDTAPESALNKMKLTLGGSQVIRDFTVF